MNIIFTAIIMDCIESYLTPEYAQFLKISNAERRDKSKMPTIAEIVINTFDKCEFPTPESNVHISPLLNGIRDLQYAQNIYGYILKELMRTGDVCDSEIRIIHKREDGLCLAVIDYISIGSSVYDMDDSLYEEDKADRYSSLFPRLCIIDEDSFYKSGYLFDYESPQVFSLNFYKKNHDDIKPSYHYYNE